DSLKYESSAQRSSAFNSSSGSAAAFCHDAQRAIWFESSPAIATQSVPSSRYSISMPEASLSSSAKSRYSARLRKQRSRKGPGSEASACGDNIPAAARDASPPMRPRSATATCNPSRASRSAIAQPMTPPPTIITSFIRHYPSSHRLKGASRRSYDDDRRQGLDSGFGYRVYNDDGE